MSSSPHVSGHVSRSSSSNNLLSLNAGGSGSSASLLTSAASLLASPSRSPPSSVQNRSPSTSINGDMNTRDPRSNTGTPSLSFAGVSRAVSFRSPAGSVASNLDKLDTTNVNEDLGEVLPIQISGEGDSNRNSEVSADEPRQQELERKAALAEVAARAALQKRFFERTDDDLEAISAFVAPLTFFDELRPECRLNLCSSLRLTTVTAGEVFAQEDGTAGMAFVILSGTCNLWCKDASLEKHVSDTPPISPRHRLSLSLPTPTPTQQSPRSASPRLPEGELCEVANVGDAVCESVLFGFDTRNPHTAEAATDLELLLVERQAFQRLLTDDSDIAGQSGKSPRGGAKSPISMKKRTSRDGVMRTSSSGAPQPLISTSQESNTGSIIYTKQAMTRILELEGDERTHVQLLKLETCLRAAELLKKLPKSQRIMLGRVLDFQVAPKRSMICVDGDVGNCMYIILDGSVSVHVKEAGGMKKSAADETAAAAKPASTASTPGATAKQKGAGGRRMSAAFIAARAMARSQKSLSSNKGDDVSRKDISTEDVERRFGKRVQRCTRGMSFGELALQNAHARRSASVYAQEETTLLCISREDYNLHLRDIQQREWESQMVILRRVTLLDSLSGEELTRIIYALKPQSRQRGEKIFSQGDSLDKVRLISTGDVKLMHTMSVAESTQQKTLAITATSKSPGTDLRDLAARGNAAIANLSPDFVPKAPKTFTAVRTTGTTNKFWVQRKSQQSFRRFELAVVGENGYIGEESLLIWDEQQKRKGDVDKWRALCSAIAEKPTTMLVFAAGEISRLSGRTQDAILLVARKRRRYREERVRELLEGTSRISTTASTIASTSISRHAASPAPPAPYVGKVTAAVVKDGVPERRPYTAPSESSSTPVVQQQRRTTPPVAKNFQPSHMLLGAVPRGAPETTPHVVVPGRDFHDRPVSASNVAPLKVIPVPPLLSEKREVPSATLLRTRDEQQSEKNVNVMQIDHTIPTAPSPITAPESADVQRNDEISELVNTSWHIEADPAMYERAAAQAEKVRAEKMTRKMARAEERSRVPKLNMRLLSSPAMLEDDEMEFMIWQKDLLSARGDSKPKIQHPAERYRLGHSVVFGSSKACTAPPSPQETARKRATLTRKNSARVRAGSSISPELYAGILNDESENSKRSSVGSNVVYRFTPGPGVFRSMSPYRNLATKILKSPRGLSGRELILTPRSRAEVLSGVISKGTMGALS